MSQFRLVTAALTLMLWASVQTQALASDQRTDTQPILFVCEHGSVKSLLAKLLFEKVAAREGLAIPVASRGTAPDAEVPEWMRSALERDGFQIGAWRPTALSETDIRSARQVVTFDVSLPPQGDAVIEHWDGLPSVGKDYAAGREAIAARVKQLIAELKRADETGRSK